jgi:hypothetical protein
MFYSIKNFQEDPSLVFIFILQPKSINEKLHNYKLKANITTSQLIHVEINHGKSTVQK